MGNQQADTKKHSPDAIEQFKPARNASKVTLIQLVPMVLMVLVLAVAILIIFRSTTEHRMNHIRRQQEAAVTERLKGQLDFALTMVEQAGMIDDDTDLEEAQAGILETLRRQRFGKDDLDYIWVHDFDPQDISQTKLLMHPTLPELEGQSFEYYIDTEQVNQIYYNGNLYSTDAPQVSHIPGTKVMVRMNQLCMASGGGFLDYYWPKPTADGASASGYLKRSYVTYYEPWNWVIGTGAYVDYIDTLVQEEQRIARRNENQLVYVFFIALLGTGILGVLSTWWVVSKLSTVSRQLEEKHTELETAQEEVSILTGLLPICSYCKKIREEDGNWSQMESYISHRSEAQFSHSICPDCVSKHHPEM